MIRSQRVLFDDSGTLRDVSLQVSDYRGAGYEMPLAATDRIYIGTELPFNSKHCEIGTGNSTTLTLESVEVWSGSAWIAVKDIIDETVSGDNALAQDGLISFSLDINNQVWSAERLSSDIPALVGTDIYNLYWLRMKWSDAPSVGTSIKYIGSKFSNDDSLIDYYPDLGNADLKSAFFAGKVDWDDQHFMAAEAIIRDMKRRGILTCPEQIFDTRRFQEAATHKVAEIVYGGLGMAYAEVRSKAAGRYVEAMDLAYHAIDRDGSGALEPDEAKHSTRYLTR